MEKEIWKPIPGWEQDYEVSNTGKIRSITRVIRHKNGTNKTYKSQLRLLRLDQHGYYHTQLKRGDKRKVMKVHRAVAMAFIPNPLNKPCVNHIDNNIRNNNVENLEWCTMKENTHWMMIQGRADRTETWVARLSQSLDFMRKPVMGTEISTGKTVVYEGVNKTANDGFQPSCITVCCQGKRKSHKGYKWEYVESGD